MEKLTKKSAILLASQRFSFIASVKLPEAYVLRDAPAGQTLSQIAAQQKQAAQITAENQKEK